VRYLAVDFGRAGILVMLSAGRSARWLAAALLYVCAEFRVPQTSPLRLRRQRSGILAVPGLYICCGSVRRA